MSAGIVLMALSALSVPLLDIISKLLMERLPVAQVGAGRLFLQAMIILPVALAARDFSRPRAVHVAAGVLLGLAIFCLNSAVRAMPVANAIAIFFVEPLLLVLLARYVLKEEIGWRRLTAVLAGLVGALVVLRPNVGAYGWVALWPLAAAGFYAWHMIAMRVMSRSGGLLATQFWTVAVATVALCLLAVLLEAGGAAQAAFLMPTVGELRLFLLMAVVAAIVHQCVLLALARASAPVLAPLRYLEIVTATALGWLVFGDFPDFATWVGTAIIVGAGLYVLHRERRTRRGASGALADP